MGTTKKIAIGLGIASGAVLAAYLFSGKRAERAKELLTKATDGLKERLKKAKNVISDDDSEINYI